MCHLFQNFPQFIVIHKVKGFAKVNKAEIDVFLELSCFFNDVGNLISGSSACSKTSLNIWKFTVHVLLKPGLVSADALGDLGSHKLKMVKSLSASVLENVLLIGFYMTKISTFIVSSS